MKVFVVLTFLAAAVYGAPSSDDAGIVGGENAPASGIPYQVAILNASSYFQCGGSIVGTRWILTAAHCLEDVVDPKYVVVGSNYISKGKVYNIAETIKHENYDKDKIVMDIGLIKVDKDIEMDDKVKIIDIADKDTPDGVTAQVSGWGMLSYPGNAAEHLQVLNVRTLSKKECQERLSLFQIYETMICTFTSKGQGVCKGDSGGPLVYEGKVVGIVSKGSPCARGIPDIYTRVYSFYQWIKGHIENN